MLIEVDIHQLEEKFGAMIPEFARGAVVHVQSHGYWPAARLTPLLRKAGREDVLVTEAPAPTHAARIDGTVVTPKGLRKGIRIATVPASRSGEALAALKPLFPDFAAASSVLQTGLENLNLIVHPAMVLPNIGAMERAKLEGRKFGFYQEGVVPAAGVLGDALDAERKLVCEAYGVEHTPMAKAIEQYYGFRSNTFYEAMQNPVYKSFPAFHARHLARVGSRWICPTPSCRACSLPIRRESRCRCTARSRRSSACCSASTRGSAGRRWRTWTSRARRRR